MRRATCISWSELRVGILIVVSFLILGTTILYLGRQQGIFAETYSLRVFMERINGLHSGAPVWLSGVRVGSVTAIHFSESVTQRDIEIILDVDTKIQERIRKDSVARIGTMGLLGDKYVTITQGSISEPVIPDGGTILGDSPVDFEELIMHASRVIDDLAVTTKNAREISEKINSGSGSLSRLVNDPQTLDEVQSLIRDARDLLDTVENGNGTIARLINDEALYSGMSSLFWSSDSMVQKIRTKKGTLGKLIDDPALYDNLTSTTARLDSLLVRIDQGEGTAGKLLSDEALYRELKSTTEKLKSLVDDIKENPSRYFNIRIF